MPRPQPTLVALYFPAMMPLMVAFTEQVNAAGICCKWLFNILFFSIQFFKLIKEYRSDLNRHIHLYHRYVYIFIIDLHNLKYTSNHFSGIFQSTAHPHPTATPPLPLYTHRPLKVTWSVKYCTRADDCSRVVIKGEPCPATPVSLQHYRTMGNQCW